MSYKLQNYQRPQRLIATEELDMNLLCAGMDEWSDDFELSDVDVPPIPLVS